MTGKRWGGLPSWMLGACVTAFLALAAPIASAQSTGSIAGVARDTTGAVLPGVTVEAASPALIEKIRTVVTDDQGNYKIVDLRPGTYSVTFTLSGFSVYKREGIELTSGFTATANAEMKVGGLEETVTVTGASPVVDVQNVQSRNLLSNEVLESLPTGGKTMGAFASLTLGATTSFPGAHDVGGNKGETALALAVHGGKSGDQKVSIDGMSFNMVRAGGSGALRMYGPNQLAIEEVSISTRGATAETETAGVQINYIPKAGSNKLSGIARAEYTGSKLQTDNLTDEARTRGAGIQAAPKIVKIYDYGAGLGGAISTDRLWFYTAHRWWGTQEEQPGSYFNLNQQESGRNRLLYTPNLNDPAVTDTYNRDHSIRVTWQPTSKQKLAGSHSFQDNCICYFLIPTAGQGAVPAPEQANVTVYDSVMLSQVTWHYPATNRLLFEAGFSFGRNHMNMERPPDVLETDIAVTELSNQFNYGANARGLLAASGQGYGTYLDHNINERASVSYVTGSHAFKGGAQFFQGDNKDGSTINQSLSYQFLNGRPVNLTQWVSPNIIHPRARKIGLFAQDQWTLNRITLTAGVRYDGVHAWVPAETQPATRFTAEASFGKIDNVPNYKDITPRLGVAYDLFGNGKTAIKASLGKYLDAVSTGIAELNSAPFTRVFQATRVWNDANGNYVPDCVLTTPTANGECLALNNQRFGTSVSGTQYADDVLTGWNNRVYSWQGSVSLQHELVAGFALEASYFRTTYGNLTVTDNTLVTPADFDPFCITVRVDPDLPTSGKQLCGLYDIKPAKFGQVNNVIKHDDEFGDRTEVYNGFEAKATARFGQGGLLLGGVSSGKTVTDNCVTVDSPQAQFFCRVSPPWSAGTQIKLSGSYPLPGDIRLSGVYQDLPGQPRGSIYVAAFPDVFPSLGRPLAAGATAVAQIPALFEPQSLFDDRLHQFDFRVAKLFNFGARRLQAAVDVYNAFNSTAILGSNPLYGFAGSRAPAWLTPIAIQAGRIVKFGAQFDF